MKNIQVEIKGTFYFSFQITFLLYINEIIFIFILTGISFWILDKIQDNYLFTTVNTYMMIYDTIHVTKYMVKQFQITFQGTDFVPCLMT